MNLLSNKVISLYDYKRTKENFNDFIAEYQTTKLECASLCMPTITQQYSEKTNGNNFPVSKTENYVVKKSLLEDKCFKYVDEIMLVFRDLSHDEQAYFVSKYEKGESEMDFEANEHISHKYMIHIKKSCIIKFATYFGFSVRKPKRSIDVSVG